MLLPALFLLFNACAHQPPAPPPDPGKILAHRSHSVYYFDINYTVGSLGNTLRVVGTVSNTIATDLDNFMVSLTVKNSAGQVLAKASTPYFDVQYMENSTFFLDLPLLHGPCTFTFRCDYLHFDDMDEGRRRFGQASDWNYFDDQINLP